MSRIASLLVVATAGLALSGLTAPTALRTTSADGPGGIGWDSVGVSTAMDPSGDGIGWD
ncbi:hypothetical protein [Streptomyces sp. NPDC051567]|uniref:hypothetical protein n=1 Tax=Streptomyces sp. NPDC051567 TaxID=3365660 RepID=UPI00379BF294